MVRMGNFAIPASAAQEQRSSFELHPDRIPIIVATGKAEPSIKTLVLTSNRRLHKALIFKLFPLNFS